MAVLQSRALDPKRYTVRTGVRHSLAPGCFRVGRRYSRYQLLLAGRRDGAELGVPWASQAGVMAKLLPTLYLPAVIKGFYGETGSANRWGFRQKNDGA